MRRKTILVLAVLFGLAASQSCILVVGRRCHQCALEHKKHHKHDDEAIASKVAKFVRTITGGQVDVYQSSTPEFEGPRVGRPLPTSVRFGHCPTDSAVLF